MIGGRELDPGLVVVARVGALVGVWICGLAAAVLAFHAYVISDYSPLGFDAHAYWLAGRSSNPYDAPPEALDAFLYSPAFKQAVSPLALLPFPAFYTIWFLLEGAAFAWLLRPLGWRWGVPCWLLCVPELLLGNVIGFIALTAVLGIRRPELWTFPLLTKITGGALGGMWFVVRRQWLYLGRYLLASLAVVGVSFAAAPSLWFDWIDFLQRSGGDGPSLLIRCTIAVVLVVVGARTGRPWLLAPALMVGTPVLAGNSVIALLAAIPRLVIAQRDPI